eukprot:TRINITY_DN1831_c0_g1_i1.p1 TRINITY_DN1831_c0_g1~~TRINITY_DN1831_c0_g1_i1.p1  ORF type:complete len:372 (+),score=83.39 TRINITY_DN1831_c0_g1_i1:125-1240(+)
MIDYSTSSASEFLHYWTSVSDEEQEDLFLEEDELWDDTEDEDFVKESEPSYHFVGNFFARVLKERTGLQPEQVSQMCSICFENFESEHTKVVLEDCQHVFCVECVKAYFEACGMDIANLKIVRHEEFHQESATILRVNQIKRVGLRCPSYQCTEVIDRKHFNDFLAQEQCHKLKNLCSLLEVTEQEEKSNNEGRRKKPKPSCKCCGSNRLVMKIPSSTERQHLFVNNKIKVQGKEAYNFCLNCLNFLCESCFSHLHESKISCKQISNRMVEEFGANQNFLQWISSTNSVTRCPHCFVTIERSMGCDHMHCVRCRNSFTFMKVSVHQVLKDSVFRFAKQQRTSLNGFSEKRRSRRGARRRGLISNTPLKDNN